jgi:hypothetical protein
VTNANFDTGSYHQFATGYWLTMRRGDLGEVEIGVGQMVTNVVHGPGQQLLVQCRAAAGCVTVSGSLDQGGHQVGSGGPDRVDRGRDGHGLGVTAQQAQMIAYQAVQGAGGQAAGGGADTVDRDIKIGEIDLEGAAVPVAEAKVVRRGEIDEHQLAGQHRVGVPVLHPGSPAGLRDADRQPVRRCRGQVLGTPAHPHRRPVVPQDLRGRAERDEVEPRAHRAFGTEVADATWRRGSGHGLDDGPGA